MIRRHTIAVAIAAALPAAPAAVAQAPTPTPPTTLTQALHTNTSGHLIQPFTVPAGMTIEVSPAGILRFGGAANGLNMSFDPLGGQFDITWPHGALSFNEGTGILDFNGTIRANAFQGPFEGTIHLADASNLTFDASQITTGILSPGLLPWPQEMLYEFLPGTGNPLQPYPANTPYFLRWISEDGVFTGITEWRSATKIKEDMGMLTASASLNWPSMAAGAESTLTLIVPGAATTSSPSVHLGWSTSLPAGILLAQAWVSANNTVSIRLRNTSTSTVDPPPLTVRATIHTP